MPGFPGDRGPRGKVVGVHVYMHNMHTIYAIHRLIIRTKKYGVFDFGCSLQNIRMSQLELVDCKICSM